MLLYSFRRESVSLGSGEPVLRHTPPQVCYRCRELVPGDRKSCPIASIDTFGRGEATPAKAKSRWILQQPGIIALLAVGFAFSMWGCLQSMRAYDMQSVSVGKAAEVQVGMTHQQVIDLMGRDAVPIPIWTGFVKATDRTLCDLSDSAKANLEKHRPPACSLDRDDSCGAHYTLKDGSGLRLIFHRGKVIYAAIGGGDRHSWKLF